MMTSMTSCAKCRVPFSKQDFPNPTDNPLVFTCCKVKDDIVIHIYEKSCLAEWVKTSERSCPTCRATLYKHQLGKSVDQLLSIFLDALKRDPAIVSDILKQSDHTNSDCAICMESFPIIQLRYDPKKNCLYHDKCGSNKNPNLVIKDLAMVVAKIVNMHPSLKEQFTPTPPTHLQRLRMDHPLFFKGVIIGSVSLTALVLNRHRYKGESWILSAVGLPAYLALVATQQVGLLIIALLNSQRREH